jgi:tetratricopeptide (TPR) repeat protein
MLGAACSGSATRRTAGGTFEQVVLPPVEPEALREFDAGMRAVRLGGPESHEKARERFEAAVELDGKLWEAWYNLGVLDSRDGHDGAAAASFSHALEVNPAHRDARLGRAEAYRRAGNQSKARADYQRALEQDPEDRAASARLASLLREAGKYEEALDVIREALRNAGADADVYVELSLIYLAQGRSELAALVVRKAADLDDTQPAIHNAMALLALEKGEDQLAFERFDHATSLDPTYMDARFNKASVLLDAGDYARAKNELTVVVERQPDDYAARVSLGVAHRGLKEYDRARASWERVVKTAPRSSPSHGNALYDLAVLEMDHLQDDEAALAALDRYLQESVASHPKRNEAEERKKELGP